MRVIWYDLHFCRLIIQPPWFASRILGTGTSFSFPEQADRSLHWIVSAKQSGLAARPLLLRLERFTPCPDWPRCCRSLVGCGVDLMSSWFPGPRRRGAVLRHAASYFRTANQIPEITRNKNATRSPSFHFLRTGSAPRQGWTTGRGTLRRSWLRGRVDVTAQTGNVSVLRV